MLKLFAVSLVIINSSLVASEPEKSAKTAAFLDRIHKCEVRELAVQGGKDSPSITEKLFGSGCYKWIPGSRRDNESLLKKCNTNPEFTALFAKEYCTQLAKVS